MKCLYINIGTMWQFISSGSSNTWISCIHIVIIIVIDVLSIYHYIYKCNHYLRAYIMDQHKGRTQNCKGHTLKICKTAFSLTPTVTQITSDNVFVFFNPSIAIFMGKRIWSDSCVNYTDFEFLWALAKGCGWERFFSGFDSQISSSSEPS